MALVDTPLEDNRGSQLTLLQPILPKWSLRLHIVIGSQELMGSVAAIVSVRLHAQWRLVIVRVRRPLATGAIPRWALSSGLVRSLNGHDAQELPLPVAIHLIHLS